MNFEIESIYTKPELDPYTNPSRASITTLRINPEDRTVKVYQDWRSNNTLMTLYHGLEFEIVFPNWPSEKQMEAWIDHYAGNIESIMDGFSARWNGNNWIGVLTDDARRSLEYLRNQAYNEQDTYYEFWNVDDWVNGWLEEITATTTDDELAAYAEVDDHIFLDAYLLEYLTNHRDALREEEEE